MLETETLQVMVEVELYVGTKFIYYLSLKRVREDLSLIYRYVKSPT